MLFFPENRLPGRGFPEHLTISDRLFDWLNDSEGMGIVDLNADERNSLPTVRTEDGNVFEIVCRKAAGKEDGRPQTDRMLWTWQLQASSAADSFTGTGRILRRG